VRLVKPDPLSDVVVGLSEGMCLVVIDGGTGCSPPRDFFARSALNVTHYRGFNMSDQVIGVAGVAADGVVRIRIFLADGEQQSAPLRDNLFAALVPNRAPIRIVGYDARGRVVAIDTFKGFTLGITAPRAATTSLRVVDRVSAPNGATATVLVGRAVRGVRCRRIVFSAGPSQLTCPSLVDSGVEGVQPVGRDVFVFGQVRDRVARVRLQFDDGDSIVAHPHAGVFVFAVPVAHLRTARQHALVIGFDRHGHRLRRDGVVFRQNP
jgi:hypothetical protein